MRHSEPMTRVEVITAILVNLRIATGQAVPVIHSDVPVSRGSSPIATIYMECTAYSPTVAQTDASPLITASGQRVRVGGIAADTRVFPFGTILIILSLIHI